MRSSAPLEIAEHVPFRYLVQHLGVAEEEYDERKIDAAFTALEDLVIFARQRDVEILLENIPNGLSSAERLMQFNEVTHLELNFCFDVGHANMGEGVEPAFDIMKERIRSTHVHDNNGKDDKHLFPLLAEDGTVDWRRAMELLQELRRPVPAAARAARGARADQPARSRRWKSSTVWRTWLKCPPESPSPTPAGTPAKPSRSPAGSTTSAGPARSFSPSCATARA